MTPDALVAWATAIATVIGILSAALAKAFALIAANKATSDAHSQQIASLATSQTAIALATPTVAQVAPTAPAPTPASQQTAPFLVKTP